MALWDPLQMAVSWLINWGDPNYLLSGGPSSKWGTIRFPLIVGRLDHPFSSAMDALYACRKQLVTTGGRRFFQPVGTVETMETSRVSQAI